MCYAMLSIYCYSVFLLDGTAFVSKVETVKEVYVYTQ